MKHRSAEMAAIHSHLARDGPRVGFAVTVTVTTARGGVAARLQSIVARESQMLESQEQHRQR